MYISLWLSFTQPELPLKWPMPLASLITSALYYLPLRSPIRFSCAYIVMEYYLSLFTASKNIRIIKPINFNLFFLGLRIFTCTPSSQASFCMYPVSSNAHPPKFVRSERYERKCLTICPYRRWHRVRSYALQQHIRWIVKKSEAIAFLYMQHGASSSCFYANVQDAARYLASVKTSVKIISIIKKCITFQ